MATQNRQETHGQNHTALTEGRTARHNQPFFHTGLWHFLVTQLAQPALRLYRLRNLSERMLEDALQNTDTECCQ